MPQLALLPLSLCPVPVTVQAGARVGVPVSVRVQKKAAPFGQGYQLRFIDVLIVISACGSVAAAAAAACFSLLGVCYGCPFMSSVVFIYPTGYNPDWDIIWRPLRAHKVPVRLRITASRGDSSNAFETLFEIIFLIFKFTKIVSKIMLFCQLSKVCSACVCVFIHSYLSALSSAAGREQAT